MRSDERYSTRGWCSDVKLWCPEIATLFLVDSSFVAQLTVWHWFHWQQQVTSHHFTNNHPKNIIKTLHNIYANQIKKLKQRDTSKINKDVKSIYLRNLLRGKTVNIHALLTIQIVEPHMNKHYNIQWPCPSISITKTQMKVITIIVTKKDMASRTKKKKIWN